MKVMSVVGARPQFVKLAPIAKALQKLGYEHVIVHTGQHYDPMLSDVFFEDLGIPTPDAHLGVGSGGHGPQTGAILSQMDEVLQRFTPDWVLVYGDTNSTLAAAVSAVKLHYPLAHLEAGLRSFNRAMPEEHNRVLTDHAADLCLAPTEVAMKHLADEGLANRSTLVGDVMTDVLYEVRASVTASNSANPLRSSLPNSELLDDGYYLATIHRAENTNDKDRLQEIVSALASANKPVVLLAHPRVRDKALEFGVEMNVGNLIIHDPLAYPDLIRAALDSDGIVTDSGGLQKEAFLLRVPCTTVRHETEWVETIDLGWNVLANTEAEIAVALTRDKPAATDATPYGDGEAATRVVEVLAEELQKIKSASSLAG